MTTPDTLATAARPAEPDTEQYACEACDRTADADDFQAYEYGEIDDPICDECLTVQADTATWDRFAADAYYYR